MAHGTAFDIAWTGRAETSSLIEATRVAARIVAGMLGAGRGLTGIDRGVPPQGPSSKWGVDGGIGWPGLTIGPVGGAWRPRV